MGAMSLLDAAMITGDALFHPINIGAVLILAPPGNSGKRFADRLYRDALTSPAVVDPRLRRSPRRGLRTGGWWAWHDEAAVDLEQHLHRRTLPVGGDRDDLWRLVGIVHSEPLDRSRPLWTAYLIDGLPADRIAFYVKAHHTIVDGVAGLRMIADGLTTDPRQRHMPPFYAVRGQAAGSPGHSGSGLLEPVRWAAGAAGVSAMLWGNVIAGQLRGAVAMLRGHTSLPAIGAPFTPFNRRLGKRCSVAAGSWPKARLRAVQQVTGTRAHDVVTAVIGGVLRSWLIERGELPGASLVALCPITVRRPEAPSEAAGNRFGAWLCPLGTDVTDPVQRLMRVHHSMREGKRHVAQYGSGASLSLLAPSIVSTILQAVTPVWPRWRTGYNVPVSSVPGPVDEMYWNGAHVEELYPVSAVFDGQTLNITTCSYADRVGIGFVADADVMPDIGALVASTEQCLCELEFAVGANVSADVGRATPPDH